MGTILLSAAVVNWKLRWIPNPLLSIPRSQLFKGYLPRMLRRFALNLALLTLSVILALACVEIGLRIAGVAYPSWVDVARFQAPDPYMGIAARAGSQFEWRLENDNFVRISNQGLHDFEHSRQKPPNTFRIAVLGDSYAEALQVPVEKNFSSVMQQQLQACPGF